MFLIKFLLAISALILYSLFAKACLKLLNIPANIRVIGIFIISGAVAGVASLIIYASLLADEQGHLGDEPQIFTMVSVSLLIAIVVSMGAVKIASANKRGSA